MINMENSGSNSKVNFFLGFFSGLALISVIGFFVLLGIMYGGSSNNADSFGATNNEKPAAVVDNNNDQPSAPTAKVRGIDKSDHYVGKLGAPIEMIIYDDMECPYCLRHEETVKALQAKYGDKMVLTYRHFPLTSIHPSAQKAAEAVECAGEQNKFFEMKDKIFGLNSEGKLGVEGFKAAAVELKLNTGKFNACLDNGDMADVVAKSAQEGLSVGVTGTPGNFVNGQLISGAVPQAQFESIFDSILK